MELKNLAIAIVLFSVIIGGFALFTSNFSDKYTTTEMNEDFENQLDVYEEINSQANDLDGQVGDEEGQEDTGSWSWNPMDWQIFKAFNVIKWLKNLITTPKNVLLALPGLFGVTNLQFYVNVGLTLLIIVISFAILVAFTKSGKL